MWLGLRLEGVFVGTWELAGCARSPWFFKPCWLRSPSFGRIACGNALQPLRDESSQRGPPVPGRAAYIVDGCDVFIGKPPGLVAHCCIERFSLEICFSGAGMNNRDRKSTRLNSSHT